MLHSTLLIPLFILVVPLLSAASVACFLRKSQWLGAFVSVTASLLITLACTYFFYHWDGALIYYDFPWFDLGTLKVEMGFLIDGKSALMLLVVTIVGFLIHFFSIGYMDHDASKSRYFAGLSLFMFSMVGIVLANNLIMLFIFWELVGFCSYMLIAHYYETDFATQASKKAFIVNRIGDFGFIIGIVWAYAYYGTVDYIDIESQIISGTSSPSTFIGLLLMCGFLGKSAQFPIHVWLPDAMAGPTPVSALIHAATMVAAGIYFLARVFFMLTPEVQGTILVLTAFMTIYAGFAALGQKDIKKILAYSTLAQLGYMGVAIGLGFPGLGLFHMATHACFKAALFLAAGSVIHALHHEQNIFKMGGLYKKMPITTLTFTVATLALCGVYGTAGFFSKDAIIEAAYLQGHPIYWVTLGGSFLTALYMGRLLWVAFYGKANSLPAEKAKESKPWMTLPLAILAVASVVSGYLGLWPQAWQEAVAQNVHRVHTAIDNAGASTLMLISTTLSWVLGLGIAFFFYRPGSKEDKLNKYAPAVYNFLKNKLWFDEIYNAYVQNIQQRLAQLLHFLDLAILSGFVIRGSAHSVGLCGAFIRKLHVGNTHAYIYWFFIGLFIFGIFGLGWL